MLFQRLRGGEGRISRGTVMQSLFLTQPRLLNEVHILYFSDLSPSRHQNTLAQLLFSQCAYCRHQSPFLTQLFITFPYLWPQLFIQSDNLLSFCWREKLWSITGGDRGQWNSDEQCHLLLWKYHYPKISATSMTLFRLLDKASVRFSQPAVGGVVFFLSPVPYFSQSSVTWESGEIGLYPTYVGI